MTARKKVRRVGSASKAVRKAARTGAQRAQKVLNRIEHELPPNLREFSRRVRRSLTALERNVERLEARYRRQAARLLRDASHRLGQYEARGEGAWRRLTTQTRRDALTLLRRLEGAVAGPPRRPTRRPARRAKARVAAATKPPATA